MTNGPEHRYQDKKPRGVSLTGWGTLLLGLVNIWRAIGLWGQSDLLLELEIGPDPRIRIAVSILWAVVFGAATAAIWTRRGTARWLAPAAAAVYGLYRLFLAFLASQASNQEARLIGFLVFYSVLTVLAAYALNRPEAKKYFSQNR